MAERRRKTAQFFSGATVNSKDFDSLVEIFQAMLDADSGLTDNAEWWLNARLWRLYLTADIRGYWDPSDGLAIALQAVEGVTPDAARKLPAPKWLPWAKEKWVYVPEAARGAGGGALPAGGQETNASKPARLPRKSKEATTVVEEQAPGERSSGAPYGGARTSAAGRRRAGRGNAGGDREDATTAGGLLSACFTTDPSAVALWESVPKEAVKVRLW